jgi:2-pyrone-4,6-dicarboxylate lactonase
MKQHCNSALPVAQAKFATEPLGLDAVARAERLIARIGEFGWIVQIQCPSRLLAGFLPILRAPGARLLVDHLGLPDIKSGTSDPGFRALLALGGEGATIKLSGAFRVSRQPFPHVDLDPFVEEIRRAFPTDRRVWGSDWPFVACAARPTYADTLAQLEYWLPDPSERRIALVEAPRRLFGFGITT